MRSEVSPKVAWTIGVVLAIGLLIGGWIYVNGSTSFGGSSKKPPPPPAPWTAATWYVRPTNPTYPVGLDYRDASAASIAS